MARGVNKVILVGNLGRDPELKHTKSAGRPFCRLSLATNEKYKSSASGENTEHTEWHQVLVWGKMAESCAQYLSKGSPLFVEGYIRQRSWEQDGITRYMTEIHAREVQFLSGGQGQAGQQPPDPDDDDCPF